MNNPTLNRRLALQSLGLPLASSLLTPLAALAQNTLPVEQVKIVCGFPVGGTADTTSRRVGDKLAGSAYSRNAAMVENKTGAGGRIALEAVKNATPDGSTLLLSAYSMLLIYPHIYRSLSYDPFKDFAPVSIASVLSHGLAVGPMVPASVKNVKDFLAWCKANPDRANYGSPAAGSTPHFLGALLSLESGVAMQHVAYRGSVPGVTDVIAGQIPAMFTPHGDFWPTTAQVNCASWQPQAKSDRCSYPKFLRLLNKGLLTSPLKSGLVFSHPPKPLSTLSRQPTRPSTAP